MASKANIVIEQATTWSTDLHLTDSNGDNLKLYYYTASSLIKKWYTSSLSVPFNVTINPEEGIVTLRLDAEISQNMRPGNYVYDVTLCDTVANTYSRIVEGVISITPSVTNGLYSSNNLISGT